MPQNIITMAYNYKLDYVQLYGKNDEIMINNLRLTLRDEICPGIKFIKAIGIADMEDVGLWRKYKNVADMLLFYPKNSMAMMLTQSLTGACLTIMTVIYRLL